jgi:metal-responsive CopG/Arc/MetJ family transcriptional regulator
MCLECIIVRGDVERLKALETALKGIKGILSVNAGISGI